jgi:hypothetical protein
MLALLTGLTVATVLTGMVPANRTASETSVALADQNGTCVDCAIRQPIKDSEIPQEPRDDGCSGCANRQPTEPTILADVEAPFVGIVLRRNWRILRCVRLA